jgi:predicted DNA-binding protein (MmcQ/YjbR family)
MFHSEALRDFCLGLDEVTEDLPFGPDVLVFRFRKKIFALMPLDANPPRLNLKMDPELLPDYRARYPEYVLPGYHMNKSHWNTVICIPELSAETIRWMIEHSYSLIKKSMKASK